MEDSERMPLKGLTDTSDSEREEKVVPNKPRKLVCGFPNAVFFIIGNEFCERFSYYGMKAILQPYLTNVNGMSDDVATTVGHSFNMLCYLTPLFGALLADRYWGKYKTILIISLIYCAGNAVMALTSIPALGGGHWYGAAVGLVVIGFGTGGIKPCVAAFGGDQFEKSEQEQSTRFFSFFYAAINAGSLLSMILTPILKGNVACFNQDVCYPLAFGIPAILMIVSLVLFLIGNVVAGYRKIAPKGNVFKDTLGCICTALRQKWRNRKSGEKKDHWLDWASGFYAQKWISDVKAVVGVAVIFIPLPFFWAVYDQQSTRWYYQSTLMDSRISTLFFQPEMFQVVNPIFILSLIPIFDHGVYPLVERCGIRSKPLRRIGVGMFVAGTAFVISGFVQLAVENQKLSNTVTFNSNEGLVVVLNHMDRNVEVKLGSENERFKSVEANKILNDSFAYVVPKKFPAGLPLAWNEGVIGLHNETIDIKGVDWRKQYLVAVLLRGQTKTVHYAENIENPLKNNARVNVICTSDELRKKLKLVNKQVAGAKPENLDNVLSRLTVEPGEYSLSGGGVNQKLLLFNGGVYTLSVIASNNTNLSPTTDLTATTQPFSISIFIQIPQILTITMAEIMVSVTGLSFAYSQAPGSMKSIVQACWCLTVFFGNLIDVAVYGSEVISNKMAELFMFAGLVYVVAVLFIFIARRYKYVELSKEDENMNRAKDDLDFDDDDDDDVHAGDAVIASSDEYPSSPTGRTSRDPSTDDKDK